MMNDFEQKLMNQNSDFSPEPNPDEFISNLHGRIEQSYHNKRTAVTGFMLLVIVVFLSTSDIAVSPQANTFYANETEDYFETDFWNVNSDSLQFDETYSEDLAYFLMDEGDLWDTVDLFNEIEIEEEITL